ncbi:MAG: IS1595 family transposase [Thiocapsa sp.]|uniref:IS1595 family transposase n=1 Tax=Thiocapsa sp. TaxID=2024551 RepID=UPI001BD15700|nr:IS1595 family transposase [Thiocapsa sp.]QVL47998.1 MAG: IS1595 family transposase [Thiocapsa sp.]
MLNIQNLVDDAKCFETVRALRWPEGVRCVHCASAEINKQGRDPTQPERQKYRCKDCGRWFDDLSETILAGHHQPLRTWVLCLYFMGLNLSNRQIGQELGLHKDDAQRMTQQLREGIESKQSLPVLDGEVEADEVYVVAGHKGNPEAVKKARKGRRRRLKGARGRGTLAKEKPPILGLIQRGGEVVLRMLDNVQQKTIKPIILACVAEGTRFYTDEYDIYARLPAWGYEHHSVCHSRGEYARDEDGDGFHEVHVNTIEGVWSLLRSWLRPHRGISQEHLPMYLSFFQFVHNSRARGKGLLPALLAALIV